ncbi:MAG: hypothetical protein Q8S43_04580 [Actinomycetota bacterium]|nr:MAG: hypothetical protein FD171_188 [Actinomycetota bacterium]MDO8949493.1 hypothetical protein [Actinomycetota bacterium]MDP3630214.1 hypothetical protein [Actinomycetota bacterium]
MKHKAGFAAVLAMAILLLATPAYAVSSVTNTFKAGDYTVNTGQSVTISASSVYDWMYVPNPYTSNYDEEVSYSMFNKPSTYAWGGLTNTAWTYKSAGHYVSPCWELYQPDFWVVTKATIYANANASAKSLAAGTKKSSRHGQYQNGWVSYGTATWFTTTHN